MEPTTSKGSYFEHIDQKSLLTKKENRKIMNISDQYLGDDKAKYDACQRLLIAGYNATCLDRLGNDLLNLAS